MSYKFLFLTNCTARKRAGVPVVRLRLAPVSAGVEGLASRWQEACRVPPACPAANLYVGRSVSEAKAAAQEVQGQLLFVSAGLGLVPAERLVPGYEISATGSEGGLPALLEARGSTVGDWWRLITDGQGLCRALANSPDALMLLALPSAYLRMVGYELASLSMQDAARVRVFTSMSGRQVLASIPTIPVMPYDDRLEAVPGFAGTRSDFPQRAMRHFVAKLKAHQFDASTAAQAVKVALSAYEAPKLPMRRRLSDEKIRAIIRDGWEACGGNSARLLRHIRDCHQVACEQSRFAALRRDVADELKQQPPGLTEFAEAHHVG